MSDREQELAAVRALIDEEPTPTTSDQAGRLGQLCRSLARRLPALGAAVTVMTAQGMQPVAVSSDLRTQALEEQQFSFGEGPCVDAFEGRQPVLVPDLRDQWPARWPGYAPAAIEDGVRAVFAFPLQVGAARLGVLDVYRDVPGGLSVEAMRHTLSFAEVALWTLLDGRAETTPDGPVRELESAVELRSVLFQAQGMVMVQLGVSLAEAMSRLRAHAYAHDRRLGDVARDVVARRLIIEPNRMPDGVG